VVGLTFQTDESCLQNTYYLSKNPKLILPLIAPALHGSSHLPTQLLIQLRLDKHLFSIESDSEFAAASELQVADLTTTGWEVEHGDGGKLTTGWLIGECN
jgi:hypothetical protein